MRKILTAVAASLATVMAMTACGSDAATPGADASLDSANPTKVVVGASPVPHAKILEFVKENLAAEAGIELEIREFDDYVLPNEALASGELDANYFQHVPYFDNQVAEKGFEFEHGEGVHIEPFALFSDKHESADQVPDGGVIALTNDPSNQYRGLKLLEEAGLLQDIAEDTTALTISDEQNPKGLKFEEAQPEVVVQQLEDPKVDAALINGNFILNAGLNADDAIAIEAVEGNPYANILAWRTDNTNPGVAKLDELLHSDEVAQFIKQEWPAGDVFPG
ncbi:ABC transporter [Tessaracoccus sp. MC1865]|uniref:MetQ/NlpA family ABC transporter substrate-binding protein n=1 Tax=Tessaracoccus sp. MC1865 TaxID=2760310 RepID=UPI00160406A0|nr:MetQ/NlpA family ABC transporter substrate-binding protein [Tessaracoccus sp. MC1865]MBB1484133.1 ABC transporter [Tessaracoccus sp. MC1865]QTO37160.1 ABC transporter [Tessaracoccus sp. MC1865]